VETTTRGYAHLSERRAELVYQLNDWAWPSNIDQLVPRTIRTPRPLNHRPDTRPDITWSIPACPSAGAMLIYGAMMLSVGLSIRGEVALWNDSVRPGGSPARLIGRLFLR